MDGQLQASFFVILALVTAMVVSAILIDAWRRRVLAERKQAEQALQTSEEQFQQIISPLQPAIWLRDTRTLKVLYVNPAYERIWGRTCDSFYADPTSFLDAVHTGDKERVLQAIQKQYQGVFFDEEYRIVRPDGSLRWIHGRTSPIHNQAGEVYRIVAVAEDITQHKQAEEALRRANLELQARNDELDAFGHTVAHDLKNPLSTIVGIAGVLADGGYGLSNEETQQLTQEITSAALKMDSIIEELMLLSGLRRMQVNVEPLDMAAIVAEAQQRLTKMIEQSQAQIIAPAGWPEAKGHAPWVEEVWINYLSNAIKYGGHPPRIELGADERPDHTIRCWVRDNGAGLTPQAQTRLFVPFERLHQARVTGYGLGLSIVRQIVEKMGGQVGIDSEAGQGSTFYFTLPAVVEHDA